MNVTVTDSELTALSRTTALQLPGFVAEHDPGDPVLDAAVLRGLAARELLAFGTDRQVLPIGALARVLEPCAAPVLMAEISLEREDEVERYGVVSAVDGRSTVFAERRHRLVAATRDDTGPAAVLERVCGIDQLTSAASHRLSVSRGQYLRADDLIQAGSRGAAVNVLVAAGASSQAAEAWLTAVTTRRTTVAMSVAHNAGRGSSGPFVAVELCWLVGADGVAWQISSGGPADHVDWDGGEPPELAVIRQVDAAELRRALTSVVGTAEVRS